jgi:hypothetical protein
MLNGQWNKISVPHIVSQMGVKMGARSRRRMVVSLAPSFIPAFWSFEFLKYEVVLLA